MEQEDRWQDFNGVWGVAITDKMKTRYLPEWFAPCFENIPGGLPPLRFKSGAFVWLRWVTDPRGVQRAAEISLAAGDVLLAMPDGGVDVLFACPERQRAAERDFARVYREVWEAYEQARRDINPEKRDPTWFLRLCQQALLGRHVSYVDQTRTPLVSDTPLTARQHERSECLARQMVWC